MFRVLVIDDSKAVHAYVKLCFSDVKDVQVSSVYNGQEAVELLKNNNQFDLVLLDWEMPIMDGPTTFKNIAQLNLNCPIVMMTSRNSITDIEQMITAGVAEYILKPFTKDILFGKIDAVTGGSLLNVS